MCNFVVYISFLFNTKTEYVNRTYRIPKELADRLSLIAQQEDISVNELVVQSCEFALDNLKKKES